MSKNIENIDRYLKSVVPTEHTSHQHRQQLRREVLREIERRRTMSVKSRSWKLAAAVALVCTGFAAAAVVGIKIYKYHYLDRDEEGRIRVQSEDGRRTWVFSNKTADNPELAVHTAEEMDLMKQQGIKELVSVREIEVNDQLDSRLLGYEYTLSDGRTIKQFEDDPETGPGTLAGERKDEARRLWQETLAGSMSYRVDGQHFQMTAEGKDMPTYDRVVLGRLFTFTKVPFTLSDGTEIGWSMGRLIEESRSSATKSNGSSADAEQTKNDLREIAILRRQDNRELIAVDELTANGKLDRTVYVYQYQLSDGRRIDMREAGGSGTDNFILSTEQRQEWRQCRDAGSGEDLGTYEQEVMEHLFVFKKQRFTLRDGTELIWSYGTPKDGQ